MGQLPEDHPCHQIHGHGYRVEVEVAGEVDSKTGFLIDYGEIKDLVQPVIGRLDHQLLNDIEGLQISSAENLSRWIWDKVKPSLPILTKITVFETESTSCEYCGE